MSEQQPLERATLGGGCFWCLEAVFEMIRGVQKVESGYMGGHVDQPTYRQVCTGATGHAEVVQITYDPKQVSFRDLLTIFFTAHDPTTLNRQGPDIGTQYRSVIFYHNEQQKQIANELIAEFNSQKIFRHPIVTQVTPATTFWVAEDYHQGYFRNHPQQNYCAFVIAPKVAKIRQNFSHMLIS